MRTRDISHNSEGPGSGNPSRSRNEIISQARQKAQEIIQLLDQMESGEGSSRSCNLDSCSEFPSLGDNTSQRGTFRSSTRGSYRDAVMRIPLTNVTHLRSSVPRASTSSTVNDSDREQPSETEARSCTSNSSDFTFTPRLLGWAASFSETPLHFYGNILATRALIQRLGTPPECQDASANEAQNDLGPLQGTTMNSVNTNRTTSSSNPGGASPILDEATRINNFTDPVHPRSPTSSTSSMQMSAVDEAMQNSVEISESLYAIQPTPDGSNENAEASSSLTTDPSAASLQVLLTAAQVTSELDVGTIEIPSVPFENTGLVPKEGQDGSQELASASQGQNPESSLSLIGMAYRETDVDSNSDPSSLEASKDLEMRGRPEDTSAGESSCNSASASYLEPPSAPLDNFVLAPEQVQTGYQETAPASMKEDPEALAVGVDNPESAVILKSDPSSLEASRKPRKRGRPKKDTETPEETRRGQSSSTSASAYYSDSDEKKSTLSPSSSECEPAKSRRMSLRSWRSQGGNGEMKYKYNLRHESTGVDYSEGGESDYVNKQGACSI